jgi:hypothetical protein
MKPEKKLDKILNYLHQEYTKDNINYVHSKVICQLADLNVNPSEAFLILDKLNIDGYVQVSQDNQWMFKINYNGILFHQNGGYHQEIKDLKRKRFKEDIFNVIIAGGTLLAGFYAIWQLWIGIKLIF